LTIAPGLTLHGQSGTIGTRPLDGTSAFINQGTIAADLAGRPAGSTAAGTFVLTGSGWSNQGLLRVVAGETLSTAGSWSNVGSFTIANGSLNLGGSVTTAGLGIFTPAPAANFSRVGGTVNLTGTLDNTDGSVELDSRTGPWNLIGGTLTNGTITTTGGNILLCSSFNGGGILSGVTLNGTLDVANNLSGNSNNAMVNVTNGMTLNGTVLVGGADGSITGHVRFIGTQTLSGNGGILFGGSIFDSLDLPFSTTVLTIASGITLHGQDATIGTNGGGTIFNQATIAADGDGTFNVLSMTRSQGILRSVGGSTLDLQSSVTIDSSGFLASQTDGTISVRGNLLGTTVNADLFAPSGTARFAGIGNAASPQLLETMSNDLGSVEAGFTKNFAYGPVLLGSNTYVRLVDNAHNSAGTGAEAVYAASLSVPASTTLDLNGLHFYTRAAQIDGAILNGSVSLIPKVVDTSTSTVATVDNTDPVYGQSVTFTATVSAIASGGPSPTGTVQFLVDGKKSGAPVTLNGAMASSAPFATLGAGVHSISAVYSGDANYTMSVASPLSVPVAQAPLTVTADNEDMAHGDSVPQLTWSVTGFVNGDTSSVVQGVPTLSTAATSDSPAGRYPITVALGTLNAANYRFTNLVNGQLTVHRKVLDVRIDWGSQSMSIVDLNRDLPFVNIKALDLIFSDDVSVEVGDLSLSSTLSSGKSYSFSGFRYDPAAHDARWSLPDALEIDRLLLALDGNDAQLDGHDGVRVLPDLYVGSQSLRFAVLPGDVNGDGVVNSQDMVDIRNQIQGTGPPDLRVWADVDGSATFDVNDYIVARKHLGTRLP
jgi:hypothetical protein